MSQNMPGARTCPACAAAERNPCWGLFHAGCHGCSVRALANSPALHASMSAGRILPAYRLALVRLFGPDGVEASHLRVKAVYTAIVRARAAALAPEHPLKQAMHERH